MSANKYPYGSVASVAQNYEAPKVDRLDQFTDGELLVELWRRKRMIELHAQRTLDDDVVARYRKEEGFWHELRGSIFRRLGHALEERRDSLVHQTSGPAARHTFFRSTEYRKSIWIITNPTGGRIE